MLDTIRKFEPPNKQKKRRTIQIDKEKKRKATGRKQQRGQRKKTQKEKGMEKEKEIFLSGVESLEKLCIIIT